MGCSPVRIAQERKGPVYTADSDKLPKSVLEGFNQVLKSAIISPRVVPKAVQTKNEKVKDQPSISQPVVDSTQSKEDPSEKPENKELERKETSREPVLSNNIVLINDLKEEVDEKEPIKQVSREGSLPPQEELRQNTEKPLIQGLDHAYHFEEFD